VKRERRRTLGSKKGKSSVRFRNLRFVQNRGGVSRRHKPTKESDRAVWTYQRAEQRMPRGVIDSREFCGARLVIAWRTTETAQLCSGNSRGLIHTTKKLSVDPSPFSKRGLSEHEPRLRGWIKPPNSPI